MNKPSFTRRTALIVIATAIVAGSGSAVALAASTGPPAPAGSGSGIVTVQRTVRVPGADHEEVVASCPSTSQHVMSGGDVPFGLSYNSAAAAFGQYNTEWSGPANSYQWDWYFLNTSPDPIHMVFVVFCQG